MNARKKLRAIMAGKRLVLMPGAYDALSARIIEAEGFEALVAGGYAGVGSMLAQADMGQSNMRDYADHYAPHLRRGRDPGLCRRRHRLRRRQQRAADGARLRGGRRRRPVHQRPGVSQPLRLSARASRSCRSSRCWPRSRPRSTRGAIPTCSSPPAPMPPASKASTPPSRAASCSWTPAPTWRSPWASTPSPDIKRVMREVGGPHMATLSQAAGPKARSLEELEAAGVCRRDLPIGRAVRGGAGGAQRAAHAQARATRSRPARSSSSRSTTITSSSA